MLKGEIRRKRRERREGKEKHERKLSVLEREKKQ